MDAGDQQAALDLARKGDLEALGRLLESFRPYLRFLARGMRDSRLQGRLDVSDLIQDTSLEAHRQFAHFRGTTVAEFAGWLRQIVLGASQRATRVHLGTGKRDATREQAATGIVGRLAGTDRSPSEMVIQHEQAARMAEALAELPEDMQQVLLGRHMDGLPYAVLAERLGRSEGAARVLYTRALRRLRELLGEGTG